MQSLQGSGLIQFTTWIRVMGYPRFPSAETRSLPYEMSAANLGITLRDRVPNVDILKSCRVQSISVLLRKSRMRWLGHIGRMKDVRLPKMVLFSKLVNGIRCQGRTRRSWQDCVRNDFTELNIGYRAQSWFRHCQNRFYWRKHFVQCV